MIVNFKFALNDVPFDLSVAYSSEDFSFSQKLRHEAQNINQITRIWRAIDQTRRINIKTTAPLKIGFLQTDDGILLVSPDTTAGFFSTQEINFIEFSLVGTILLYESRSIVYWETTAPDWLLGFLKLHCDGIEPQLIGTTQHLLPQLKEAAKAEVNAQARRRANIMLGNAQAILEFLGEIV